MTTMPPDSASLTPDAAEAPLRPAAALRREAILAVAHAVFLEAGYDGASMSQIAARLGGSKGTLYSYFDSKQALFEALIVDNCARSREAVFDVDGDLPLPELLAGIGRGYLRLVTSDWATQMFQVVALAARRWPALGALFYAAGPAAAIERLSRHLDRHAAAGSIRVADSRAAAETFLTLCRGMSHLRRLLAVDTEPDEPAIDRQVDEAVAQFLKLHGL